jgi:dimethylaniline monooxygenase (N-oxide forming)
VDFKEKKSFLQTNAFSSFSSSDFPLYPKPADFVQYFISYAHHFQIYDRIVFGVSVESVIRNTDDTKWLVALEGEDTPRSFDRVVLACGAELTPRLPEIEGLKIFEGELIHSQAYKRHVKSLFFLHLALLSLNSKTNESNIFTILSNSD